MASSNVHGQDLPPRGLYPPVQSRRHLPGRGYSAGLILLGVAAVAIWGHRKSQLAIDERRELFRETQWSRLHLIPLLTAESDRDLYRRQYAAAQREQKVMQGVPGWKLESNGYVAHGYVKPELLQAPPDARERAHERRKHAGGWFGFFKRKEEQKQE